MVDGRPVEDSALAAEEEHLSEVFAESKATAERLVEELEVTVLVTEVGTFLQYEFNLERRGNVDVSNSSPEARNGWKNKLQSCVM